MQADTFNGLTMPVFTAFSWAGEETAINYALSQLELFAKDVRAKLPPEIREDFAHVGISTESQAVYIATSEDVETDVHIVFNARPLSFEIQMALSHKKALSKGLARAMKDAEKTHKQIAELGPEWELHIQQMQIDEDSGIATHYQDLYKDTVANFDAETATAILSKAAYLNSEEQWVIPVYISRRFPAEQVSIMGLGVSEVMKEHIMALMPAIRAISGRTHKAPSAKGAGKAKTTRKTKDSKAKAAETEVEESFTYLASLKPLHLRRGFINLTPKHWPFFAINARTETRDVTIQYNNGIYDKKCSVWRLQPSDQARIVLSPAVHLWLENNFGANEQVKVIARKLGNNDIQISLSDA